MKRVSIALLATLVATVLSAQTTWKGIEHEGNPWVKNTSRPYPISEGLDKRHIAIWASHGRYYDQTKQKWQWQRPPLFGTCEDLFTQTIVVPYLIPMLEKAGAVVFTPRERDWQPNEVIVDNDNKGGGYRELSFSESWKEAPMAGFAWHDGHYQDEENPFIAGSARMIEATKNKNKLSHAVYLPEIPEEGRYAVYVSYQTLANSVDDAHYTVYHRGQATHFTVNQQMGGSTWVYLGTFDFGKGCSNDNCVELSNYSSQAGVITADAVRFGGGMGNIERGGSVSGFPRCLEGARYTAQWAGMPYKVYSSKAGVNDYADDINARSLMVNELCGGSAYAPDSSGRRVPIELSLAVHSDAGHTENGYGVYGTLTICTTQKGDSLLAAGKSRQMSKDLAEALLTNTVNDMKYLYGEWTAREVYDRNYSETRLPVVPSAILETLSHQNFGDMRFGLDPNFRFQLARSVYKTLARYINEKHKKDVTIQPLPPKEFRIDFSSREGEAKLTWQPTLDEQEPTAKPTSYIVYMAEGERGFDNGTVINSNSCYVKLSPSKLTHFKVAAINKGGESFPTQVLSVLYRPQTRRTILIVDGFHRLASPTLSEQGFNLDDDPGVSYGSTYGWLGQQQVFDVERIGVTDSTGLGYTNESLAGQLIAGNDFNVVRSHAETMEVIANCNIVSCSSEVLELMPLYQYDLIDLVLGLEKNDQHSLVGYKALTTGTRHALAQYLAQGGKLFVSGAFVGSDMQSDDERHFLADLLKCRFENTYRADDNNINGLGTSFSFYNRLNSKHFAAVSTDRLTPSTDAAFCAMTYADGTSACVAYAGKDYRTFTMGFPFECIIDKQKKQFIMSGIINFLLQ